MGGCECVWLIPEDQESCSPDGWQLARRGPDVWVGGQFEAGGALLSCHQATTVLELAPKDFWMLAGVPFRVMYSSSGICYEISQGGYQMCSHLLLFPSSPLGVFTLFLSGLLSSIMQSTQNMEPSLCSRAGQLLRNTGLIS